MTIEELIAAFKEAAKDGWDDVKYAITEEDYDEEDEE